MSDKARIIKALLVKPMQCPEEIELDCSVEGIQKIVGGYFEILTPFKEPVALLVNEEGRLRRLKPNRAIKDSSGEIRNVILGDFLIVGLGAKDFKSLTKRLINRFENHFHCPEAFVLDKTAQ